MGKFSTYRFGAACATLLIAGAATADNAGTVSAASLEGKARIASMEQVNVTAEIGVDESAPAPSATVSALLQQLDGIDGGQARAPEPTPNENPEEQR